MTKTSYLANARSDAKETAENFIEEIVQQLWDTGTVSDDLNNDYPKGDAYHHESHVDKWYDLQDACAVISELSEYEETDSGLWESQDMKKALGTCAAYTYGNAVYSLWIELVKAIMDDDDVVAICAKIGAVDIDHRPSLDPIKFELTKAVETAIEAF